MTARFPLLFMSVFFQFSSNRYRIFMRSSSFGFGSLYVASWFAAAIYVCRSGQVDIYAGFSWVRYTGLKEEAAI